ncbi:sodium:solute symporter family protein [Oceanobacillus kimchii]|uniref:sodium:solute symporter family protein n=1 Tax=Oceanobacillus TaxID=182709 RepID=UPI00034CC445|nr:MULTISPECIES: sodium:solute symporter family protein [Oceanobacillus]MCT1578991.1 sodium:solute symporter family protein [Oceanobacillus kimchii]MCT2137916.1 sodium:solute symporter family protein [Oceanobacillus kimchii]OEH53457.1 sodium:proline symporter [Oceanobacillus sp. E9]
MELTNNPALLWFVAGYGVFMIILGIYFSKKISNSEDFILAGKGLGSFVLAGTLLATWMGSGSITGGETSMAYSYGIIPALMMTIPTLLGIGILYFIAPKIREFGKFTVSGILEAKYGKTAQLIASIIIILAFVGIVSYAMTGLGFVLNVTTGMSVQIGTLIGAVLIIFLATIGGLRSVAPTDAISAFLALIGLFLALPIMFSIAGGWGEITANVPEQHLTATSTLSTVQLLGFLLPSFFLLLGDQNMYQRLAASKGVKTSKKAQIFWLLAILLITPTISLIAFTSRSLFDDIDPGMALIGATTVLPTAVGGILLAAAAAFIVTTGNSYLLSAATNVTYDIVGKYFKKDASDKQLVLYTKIFIVILGAFSFILGNYFPTVLEVQMYAYTVYGAGLTPALLAVFFWKRVNAKGGISSMIAGVGTTLLWELILGKPFDLNSVIVAIPVAVIVLIVVTLMTTEKPVSKK